MASAERVLDRKGLGMSANNEDRDAYATKNALNPTKSLPMLTLMKEKEEGILSAFKREPGQAKFLLEVIILGAIGIVAWDIFSGKVLPEVASMGVMLRDDPRLRQLSYGADRATRQGDGPLAGRIGQAADAAQRPTRRAAVSTGPQGETVLPPLPQANFQQTYFLLRLNEEVKTARRNGRLLSLIALDVHPQEHSTPELREQVAFEIAQSPPTTPAR